MAAGDLEAQVEVGGRDEISDMAAALEVFRRHALEVQRLNLVEKLAAELQDKNDELESVLAELERAQDQIVMREKLAALGELTAGVAHEIRNPLNFVKNFSEGSEDLLAELQETLEENIDKLDEDQRTLVREIASDLNENLGHIRSHGERADRIVSDMLMMGRGGGEQQPTDINRLLDQNARLAYHSARASDEDFQLSWREDLDPEVGEISVVPQDLGRVFLNVVSNACYATADKLLAAGPAASFQPTLWLTTRREAEQVEVRIRDNGNGIPGVTVQTCGDLPTIGPIVEGQPSTVFPLQTVSVPSNVNSYYRAIWWTRFSIRFSRPNPPTAAPGWGWQFPTTLCGSTAERSG